MPEVAATVPRPGRSFRALLAPAAALVLLASCDRSLTAPEPVELPAALVTGPSCAVSSSDGRQCCKICRTGKACGDTYIARDKTCHAGVVCACNADEVAPQPILTCTPGTVERGQRVTCQVSTEPADTTMQVQKWTFSDGQHVVTSTDAATTWEGPLVVSGTVTVQVLAGGPPQTATTNVTVNPRSWPTPWITGVEAGHGNLPDPPRNYRDLANTPSIVMKDLYITQRVPDGPNEGFWYVVGRLYDIEAPVQISRAFDPSHPWYRKQRSGPAPSGRYCARSELPQFERIARQHEGLLLMDPSQPSHIAEMNRLLQ